MGVSSKCGVQSKRKHKSHNSCVCVAGLSERLPWDVPGLWWCIPGRLVAFWGALPCPWDMCRIVSLTTLQTWSSWKCWQRASSASWWCEAAAGKSSPSTLNDSAPTHPPPSPPLPLPHHPLCSSLLSSCVCVYVCALIPHPCWLCNSVALKAAQTRRGGCADGLAKCHHLDLFDPQVDLHCADWTDPQPWAGCQNPITGANYANDTLGGYVFWEREREKERKMTGRKLFTFRQFAVDGFHLIYTALANDLLEGYYVNIGFTCLFTF